jgi:hypothetical protein
MARAKTERETIVNARRFCKCCAKCGRKLASGEPIWRDRAGQRRSVKFGSMVFHRNPELAPHCEQCATSDRIIDSIFSSPKPCEHCSRLVYQLYNRVRHRHTFCCSECEKVMRSALLSAAAKQQRAKVRGSTRQCKTCDKPFEPARTDASYCSNACRQKAYRRTLAA